MEYTGYFGGCILSLQFIPQIYKIYKTKSVKDLSFVFLIMNIIGLCLMMSYSIYENQKPIYIPLTISLFNTFIVLFMLIYYRKNDV